MATLATVKTEQNIQRKTEKVLEVLNREIKYNDVAVMKNKTSKK